MHASDGAAGESSENDTGRRDGVTGQKEMVGEKELLLVRLSVESLALLSCLELRFTSLVLVTARLVQVVLDLNCNLVM